MRNEFMWVRARNCAWPSACWRLLVLESPKKPCPHPGSSSVSQKFNLPCHPPCKQGSSLPSHCQKLPAFSLGWGDR